MICSVSIHPFEPVTVAVYVPGVVTLILLLILMVPVPFDQEAFTPPEAAKVITLILQSNMVVLAKDTIDATGTAIFCVTT